LRGFYPSIEKHAYLPLQIIVLYRLIFAALAAQNAACDNGARKISDEVGE